MINNTEEVFGMTGEKIRKIKNQSRKDKIAEYSGRGGREYSGSKRRGVDSSRRGSAVIRRRKRSRRRRRTYRRRILLTLMAVLLLAAGGGKVWSFSEDSEGWLRQKEVSADLRRLHSPNAVLLDAESKEILAELDGGRRIYPASLTKLMTAMIAVEQIRDMDGTMVLPSDYFSELYAENASMAGFLPGERVTFRNLLYGILLPSGAECCLAFAREIAGSEEAFVRLMNEKARELGMENTHFCNSTGLHNPEHYSTAEDMAALLAYALKEEDFREAFTSQSRSIPPSDMHPDGFTFASTMFQYLESPQVTDGEILGGKTGYTPEAGLCLASLARVGGKEYILVTANAKGDHETEPFHILDAVDVYNQIGEKNKSSLHTHPHREPFLAAFPYRFAA